MAPRRSGERLLRAPRFLSPCADSLIEPHASTLNYFSILRLQFRGECHPNDVNNPPVVPMFDHFGIVNGLTCNTRAGNFDLSPVFQDRSTHSTAPVIENQL